MTVDSVSERVRLAVKIRDDLASLANLRAAVREVGIVARRIARDGPAKRAE